MKGAGISFPTVLFLLFLGLKLGGVIDWSWWWVTAPLWIPLGFALICFALLGILMAFVGDD